MSLVYLFVVKVSLRRSHSSGWDKVGSLRGDQEKSQPDLKGEVMSPGADDL